MAYLETGPLLRGIILGSRQWKVWSRCWPSGRSTKWHHEALRAQAWQFQRRTLSLASSSAATEGARGDAGEIQTEAPASEQEDEAATEARNAGSSSLSAWVAPGTAVYANPICSQLDQLLMKCEDFEAVLALLTTHRGVFFVHNLVTAIQVLGAISQEVNDVIATNEMLRDPRYDLLVRDIIKFVPTLDFLAMTNVACSLWQLDHRHYPLLTRLMRPLLQQSVPDIGTLLRCAQAYSWAGYQAHFDFFSYFADALADAAQTLPAEQLVTACIIFGDVQQYSARFFVAAENALLERELLNRHALPTGDVARVAEAFGRHLRKDHDKLFECVARILVQEAVRMSITDITRCLVAFRRVALYFPEAIQAGLTACGPSIRLAWLLRRRVEGTRTADVAALLECAAYFNVEVPMFNKIALDYLESHVEEVPEDASIRAVYAMSVIGASSTHSRLLRYLFRKMGASTAWEGHELRMFHLWVCQLLQFPWLDARMPRRCFSAGLRAWCLHRRGYGCPFPDEVRDISAELMEMGVDNKPFVVVPNTPYEVDMQIGDRKAAVLVVSEVARNADIAVGGTVLQLRHLRALGWRIAIVPRSRWLGLATDSPQRRSFLWSVLAQLRVPSLEVHSLEK